MSDLILWLLQTMALFAALAGLVSLAALWLFVGLCYAAEIWRAWRSR